MLILIDRGLLTIALFKILAIEVHSFACSQNFDLLGVIGKFT